MPTRWRHRRPAVISALCSAAGALTLALPGLSASASAEAAAPPTRPHIVMMLIDDLGWGSLQYNGNPHSPRTPKIDRLVASGVRLDRAYAYKYCSPTRCSLLSGRLPIHVNTDNNADLPFAGIPAGMTTIAERLTAAGYECHMAGKWHAGFASPALTPHGRGFKTSLGYFHADEDHWTQIFPGPASGICENVTGGTGGVVDLWDTDEPAHGENGTEYGDRKYLPRGMNTSKYLLKLPLFWI